MLLNHKDVTQEVFRLPIPAQQLRINLLLRETTYTLDLETFSILNSRWNNASSQGLRV